MAESNRIEDLRKRYHENPRRFFAPLANEYRKGGFLDRAILLCEKHLGEQPDNMNGLVVYGQVLFESGKHDEARAPFEMALKLDQENLIALRHLGDIARIGGDNDLAKTWYLKVLEVDRRNDEVLDILEQLGGAEGGVEPASEAPRSSVSASSLISVAPNVSVSGGEGGLEMLDLDSPFPAPTPAPKPFVASPAKTVVINVKDLAAADLRAAQDKAAAEQAPAAQTIEIEAAPSVPVAAEPPARPSRRASLLDIDFSELPVDDVPLAVPLAPDSEKTLIIEAPQQPVAADEIPGLEMADFSAEVTPMAGLESTEFIGGDVAAPVEGLDRVDLTAADINAPAAIEGFAATADLAAIEPPALAGAAELATDPIPEPISFDDLDVSESTDSTPLPTLDSEPDTESRPKPRMTRADLASLPLLADYGLEDDVVEAPSAPIPALAAEAEIEVEPVLEPEPRSRQPTPTFVTETMAALYIKQGFRNEAIEVYRQLIIQDPADAGLKDRLAALERGDDAAPEFEAPPPDAVEPEPAPANAALSEVSFAGVGLSTPDISKATPILTPAVVAGPSAREFFSGFAKRGASPSGASPSGASNAAAPSAAAQGTAANSSVGATQSPVSATGWPLDSIFGAAHEVRDLHAAEVLAGVGTFTGPSGGTGIEELFGAGGAATPAARSVSRASKTLKFDQFFAKEGAGAADAPAAPEAGPAAAGDDELNQFQGWLKGLKP